MEIPKDRIEIASDVNQRDGIGIIVFRNDEPIAEIFRDDSKKTRVFTMYSQELNLEDVEEYITVFKREIPWDFID